jgi:ferredoxin
MCEFCHQHGEGKKWYLQMKNYSDELLHAELSPQQKKITHARTRIEWVDGFIEQFTLPAAGPAQPPVPETRPSEPQPPRPPPSEAEIVARAQVEHFGQVLPIEDVEAVIDLVNSITRLPCGCRYITTGKADQRYCFGVALDPRGILGRFPDAAASFEVLEKETAKKIFRDYDREGLVHSIWTGITPYVVGVCNCDRDCAAYRHYIENSGSPTFFRAEYVGQVDWNLCTGCKTCIKQCQFGALFYSSARAKVRIHPARCFGCGLCRAVCPKDAIVLLPRQQHPEAADIWLRGKPG